MAVQQGQSSLFAKLGDKLLKAQAEHKGREPNVGNPVLPAGIEGGIAQLADCKLGVYQEGTNKGQVYFMAAGIVHTPASVGDIKCRGLRTQIGPEPLCDTPTATGKRKTFSDHYGWMRDNLFILGLDIDNYKGTPQQIEDQIKAGMEALRKTIKPFFRFRTWKGSDTVLEERGGKWFAVTGSQSKGPYPSKEAAQKVNPYAGKESRVQHEWNGQCDPPGNHEPIGGNVQDSSSTTAQSALPMQSSQTNGTAVTFDEFPVKQGSTDPVLDYSDTSLEDLVRTAGEPDPEGKAARDELEKRALAIGMTKEDVENATDWEAVADMIQTLSNSESAADEGMEPDDTVSAAEEWKPKKEQCYYFKPLVKDKSTKKMVPAAKPIECEVMLVDDGAKTVTLKNMTDGKTLYKGVAWTDLIRN